MFHILLISSTHTQGEEIIQDMYIRGQKSWGPSWKSAYYKHLLENTYDNFSHVMDVHPEEEEDIREEIIRSRMIF